MKILYFLKKLMNFNNKSQKLRYVSMKKKEKFKSFNPNWRVRLLKLVNKTKTNQNISKIVIKSKYKNNTSTKNSNPKLRVKN